MVEHLLANVRAAVDAVHDLERARIRAGLVDDAIVEPSQELASLFDVAESQQRVDRERRIADPGEPIVPVALSTHLLRKPHRRGRDQSTGRRIGEQAQGDRGTLDDLAPAPDVGRPAQP